MSQTKRSSSEAETNHGAAKMANLAPLTEFEDAYYSIVSPSTAPSTTSCIYRILPAAHSFRHSLLPITTCSLRRLSLDYVHRFELVAFAVPRLDYCSNCVDCLRSMSTASAIHLSLSILRLLAAHLSTILCLWPRFRAPILRLFNFMCQLHCCVDCPRSMSTNARLHYLPGIQVEPLLGKRSYGRTLRSTTQSMLTVFGVCPWTRNLILYHSLRCHYLVVVHLTVSGACPQATCQFTWGGEVLCKAGY